MNEEKIKEILIELARCEGIYGKGALVANLLGKRYGKKHGSLWEYEDGDFKVVWDDYAPNLEIYWKNELVFTVHLGSVVRFRFCKCWLERLEEAYERAKKKKDEIERKRKDERRKEFEERWGVLNE